MYTLAIVGVYACLASGGRVTGTGMPPSPSPEKHREAAAISRFFIQGSSSSSCNRLLLGKGSIKKEQPPHSSCSLIPKGFHYIYFIPYI